MATTATKITMNSVSDIAIRSNTMTQSAQELGTAGSTTVGLIDRAGFTALVDEHQDRLRGFLFRMTRSKHDAEDLTQDTFVKAYRNIHRYDSKYSFSTWLYTIARRTAYNHFRDTKPTAPLEYDLVETADRPDEKAVQGDESHWVWEAAKSLKPDYREALGLKYIDDLSIEEIAKIMGKTKTNIKIILFRARNQLKRMRTIDERNARV